MNLFRSIKKTGRSPALTMPYKGTAPIVKLEFKIDDAKPSSLSTFPASTASSPSGFPACWFCWSQSSPTAQVPAGLWEVRRANEPQNSDISTSEACEKNTLQVWHIFGISGPWVFQKSPLKVNFLHKCCQNRPKIPSLQFGHVSGTLLNNDCSAGFFDFFNYISQEVTFLIREGLGLQMFPKSWHCQNWVNVTPDIFRQKCENHFWEWKC